MGNASQGLGQCDYYANLAMAACGAVQRAWRETPTPRNLITDYNIPISVLSYLVVSNLRQAVPVQISSFQLLSFRYTLVQCSSATPHTVGTGTEIFLQPLAVLSPKNILYEGTSKL